MYANIAKEERMKAEEAKALREENEAAAAAAAAKAQEAEENRKREQVSLKCLKRSRMRMHTCMQICTFVRRCND